ncbi:hypothetical protein ACFL3T_00390 [Patescibacteria group bacterium]
MDKLSLYEIISCIDDVEVPPEFESELVSYILGTTDGMYVAKIIAQILKVRGFDEISEFIEALEDHIFEVMLDTHPGLNSNMVTNKKMTLCRLIIHFIYLESWKEEK